MMKLQATSRIKYSCSRLTRVVAAIGATTRPLAREKTPERGATKKTTEAKISIRLVGFTTET